MSGGLTASRGFHRGDYIVILPHGILGNFRTNYCFMQREICDYLRPVIDCGGSTDNECYSITYEDKTSYRFATDQEIRNYRIVGGPYDVTQLQIADNIKTAEDLSVLDGKFISFNYTGRFYKLAKVHVDRTNNRILLLNNCHPNWNGHDKSVHKFDHCYLVSMIDKKEPLVICNIKILDRIRAEIGSNDSFFNKFKVCDIIKNQVGNIYIILDIDSTGNYAYADYSHYRNRGHYRKLSCDKLILEKYCILYDISLYPIGLPHTTIQPAYHNFDIATYDYDTLISDLGQKWVDQLSSKNTVSIANNNTKEEKNTKFIINSNYKIVNIQVPGEQKIQLNFK